MNNKYNIIHFDEIDSTNTYIKSNYKNLQEFTIVKTDLQLKGKGRMGRTWVSERSENLMFSTLLKPIIDSSNVPLISLIVGAAVQMTLNKYVRSYIKWPNDIIVNDKKICGILVEGVIGEKIEAIIPGVGININQEKFSDDLIIKATSLYKEVGHKFDLNTILNEYINNFDKLYNDFLIGNNRFINIVRSNNYLKNKEVYYNNKLIKIIDITDKGNLKVIEDGNIKELFFGEVTLTNIYNNKKGE